MKVEIKVPSMGESISQATVGTLLKPSGSTVRAEEEIVELETEKVNQVLYAAQAGIITFNVKPDDIVAIGQVIGTIETQAAASDKKAPQSDKRKEEAKEPLPVKAVEKNKKDVRFAKEQFINGIKEKKEGNVDTPAPEPALEKGKKELPTVPSQQLPAAVKKEETRRRMSTIRRVIAQRLVEAKNSMAMLTTFNEVDLTEIIRLRERYKEAFAKKYNARLGFMSFFIKAAIHALKAFPDVNSYIDGDQIVHREYYDIGVAVGTEKGLVVPVLRDCDLMTFASIEKTLEEYAVKAREGSLNLEELQGGGFTITNGGVYGSLLSTPIINPPQCGILGMHKIQKRAVVVDDAIVIRPMMYLALSYDHRIVDGKEAVTFLIEIKNVLEDPSRLFLQI